MAGGPAKSGSKGKKFGPTNETLKEFDSPVRPESKKNKSGTLSPGESISFDKEKNNSINWSREFLLGSVQKEETVARQKKDQDVKKAIQELRQEIKKLIESTEGLEKEIANISEQNIVEFNTYQLNFLMRVKTFIVNFSKNISQASSWLESFNHKKSRKNAFWGQVKNKKNGGEQYLFSNEHTASRSAN